MPFHPQHLIASLRAPSGVGRFRVALSGGVDSTVLLYALVSLLKEGLLSVPIDAIHVHHGLSLNADRWSDHCRSLCESLGILYREARVVVDRHDKSGLEAAARHARYAALEASMSAETGLLMAHHADDQAETLLLQLLRGSGPQGLSAMPRKRRFGSGQLLRPLLDVTRADILAWAHSEGLRWLEDESNREQDRDRNFLRMEIVPRMKRRWPSLARSLSRSARLCAESSELNWEQAQVDRVLTRMDTLGKLRWPAAATLNFVRRKNLLRYWITENDLPLPNADRLEQIAHDLWEAGEDRQPLVHWPGAEVRRYRDALYIGKPLASWSPPERITWDGQAPLDLNAAGRLEAHTEGPGNESWVCLQGEIEIRFRQDGETCRLAGRTGTRSLKKVLQELGVEPWLRDRIPLIYCDAILAAIGDRAVCEGFRCPKENGGVLLCWYPEASD